MQMAVDEMSTQTDSHKKYVILTEETCQLSASFNVATLTVQFSAHAELYNSVQFNSQNPPSQRRPVPALLSSHLSLQLALKMQGSLGKGLMPFFAAEALSLESTSMPPVAE